MTHPAVCISIPGLREGTTHPARTADDRSTAERRRCPTIDARPPRGRFS